MDVLIQYEEGCAKLIETDFDEYKIPSPPHGCKQENESLKLLFNDSAEAIKYGLHLGDIQGKMEQMQGFECAIEKIRLIIYSINNQADFKSLNFPDAS